jgi:hypothetical protein
MFDWLRRIFHKEKKPDIEEIELMLKEPHAFGMQPETEEGRQRYRERENLLEKRMRQQAIAKKNQEHQKSTLGYGLKSRNFRPRPASEKKLWHLDKKPPKKLEED